VEVRFFMLDEHGREGEFFAPLQEEGRGGLTASPCWPR